MSQHIGAPCSPLVKVGDTVKLGQKIGDGEGVCSPVHAHSMHTAAIIIRTIRRNPVHPFRFWFLNSPGLIPVMRLNTRLK